MVTFEMEREDWSFASSKFSRDGFEARIGGPLLLRNSREVYGSPWKHTTPRHPVLLETTSARR